MRWLMRKNRILNSDEKSIETDVVGVVGQTGSQPAVVGFLEYHDILHLRKVAQHLCKMI